MRTISTLAVCVAFASIPTMNLEAQPKAPGGLPAAGPTSLHPEQMALFGQFVGDWEFDLENHGADGVITQLKGEWSFGWVLEGRAVQDVWRVPARSANANAAMGYGTTIRFFDPSIAAWRVTWVGVVTGVVLTFIARRVGDEIVMEQTPSEDMTRWIFSDITRTSFKWRNVSSDDDGKTWRTNQIMQVRRTLNSVRP